MHAGRQSGRLVFHLAVLCASTHLFAAQYVIISSSSGGEFKFTEAEIITINNSDKVRVLSVPQGSAPSTDPKQASRLPETKITSFLVFRSDNDHLVARSDGEAPWQILVPEGKEGKDLSQMWSQATIVFRKDKSQKTPDVISRENLYAIVRNPIASEGVGEIARQVSWLRSPGDALLLRVAMVKAYPGSPAVDKLRKATVDSLVNGQAIWSRGGASRAVLDRWLDNAHAADAIFPQDAEIKALSAAAYHEEQVRARQAAILGALDAGEQADAFLIRYNDYEAFQHYSDRVMELREKNYSLSARLHSAAAANLKSEKKYAAALAEYRIAARRDPSSQSAANGVEEMRLELARISSLAAAEKRKGVDVRSPQQVQVQRHLLMAEQYLRDSKLPESQKELDAGQAIDASVSGVVLVQAKVFASQGQLGKALAVMDRYAGVAATDQEFMEGEKYRTTLNFDLQKQNASLKTKLQSEFDGGKFSSALQTAAAGLNLDLEDTDFQYYAGLSACILKRCQQGAPLLRRYLEGTDARGGDSTRRINAVRLIRSSVGDQVAASTPAADKNPSQRAWSSGALIPADVVYDPISLAFLPKVSQIKASNKLSVSYEWAGPALRSVHSVYEDKHTGLNLMSGIAAGLAAAANSATSVVMQDADRDTNDFFFEYATDFPQVSRVTKQKTSVHGGTTQMNTVPVAGTMTAADVQSYTTQPDEQRDSSQGFLTLWNSPHVDTTLAFQLSGRRVAVAFSGNSLFNPFVWDSIHLFEIDYDQLGRVRYAWEFGNNAGRLEFAWDGPRLLTVKQHAGRDGGGAVVYSRTLTYSSGRLMSEAIEHQGKNSKIEYRYDKRGVLIEADCSEDFSLDGRSRKVTFLQ